MSALESLFSRAAQVPATVALPESTDTRILQAAVRAAEAGVAKPVLLLGEVRARELAEQHQLDLGAVRWVDPADARAREQRAQVLLHKRARKGMTPEQAHEAAADPLVAAVLMCEMGEVDGVVAGAVTATADVVRTALQVVGVRAGTSTVSSFVLMLPPESAGSGLRPALFSDCGLVIAPDSAELAEIARATGHSARRLLAEEPRVAMLSFSTAGSARHEAVTKVSEATAALRAAEPDWSVLGEVQFDAAWDPELLARKAPDAAFQAPANVFVFPSLEAGNIGYKIAQRLGGWQAVGPVLQGLKRPVNDLSRGCNADDVLAVMALTSLQAAQSD